MSGLQVGKGQLGSGLTAQNPYTETQRVRDWDWGSPAEDASQELPCGPLGPWINLSSDHVEREDGAVARWLHSQGWPGCPGAEPTLPSENRVAGSAE